MGAEHSGLAALDYLVAQHLEDCIVIEVVHGDFKIVRGYELS